MKALEGRHSEYPLQLFEPSNYPEFQGRTLKSPHNLSPDIINKVVPYQTKTSIVSGSEYREVHKKILDYFQTIKARTKRKPYVRSPFFHKEKVFFDFFWTHLFQKSNWKDRTRRLKFFPAAVDLIKNTHQKPESKPNPNKKSETLHRFAGLTKEKH